MVVFSEPNLNPKFKISSDTIPNPVIFLLSAYALFLIGMIILAL